MIVPYVPEELLEINSDIYPTFSDGVIVVDNFYKNIELLYNVLQNNSVPRWKWDPKGKNFSEYYDCRPVLPGHFVNKQSILIPAIVNELVKKFFKIDKILEQKNDILEFNYYRNIKKGIPNHFQHFPHIDESYNCVVYLDKICSGGTAIYDYRDKLDNKEHVDLLFDNRNIKFKLVEAKFNRLVIFSGWNYHGGYIENHDCYLDNWRINHIMFYT
jgi:hypothetical protein